MNGGAKMFDDGYYHCERLLTMKDKYGNIPDIFIVVGNRAAGKSYSIKCRQSLKDIESVMDGEKFSIIKISGKTKAGRDYINCTLDVSNL